MTSTTCAGGLWVVPRLRRSSRSRRHFRPLVDYQHISNWYFPGSERVSCRPARLTRADQCITRRSATLELACWRQGV